jgi:hypothetical protein
VSPSDRPCPRRWLGKHDRLPGRWFGLGSGITHPGPKRRRGCASCVGRHGVHRCSSLRVVAGDSPAVKAIKVLARAHQRLIWERHRQVLRLRSSPAVELITRAGPGLPSDPARRIRSGLRGQGRPARAVAPRSRQRPLRLEGRTRWDVCRRVRHQSCPKPLQPWAELGTRRAVCAGNRPVFTLRLARSSYGVGSPSGASTGLRTGRCPRTGNRGHADD